MVPSKDRRIRNPDKLARRFKNKRTVKTEQPTGKMKLSNCNLSLEVISPCKLDKFREKRNSGDFEINIRHRKEMARGSKILNN